MATPTCEVCGHERATSFSYFGDRWDTQPNGQWKLAGACSSESEAYYVEFERFFESPFETANWLGHLSRKPWLDWKDFARTMQRFAASR